MILPKKVDFSPLNMESAMYALLTSKQWTCSYYYHILP